MFINKELKKNKPQSQICSLPSAVQLALEEIYCRLKHNSSGQLATYIPELAKADPESFGICIATTDGFVYEIGDSRAHFSIQSISKIFIYGLALSDHGPQELLKHVGVEPSGEAFNSITFDQKDNRPFNPMVNAGAIVTTALISGNSYNHRLERIMKTLADFAGHAISIDQKVFLSERATGHRNRAIAYLELGANMIKAPIEEHLDLYFSQCSALVNAYDLSVMAATLANFGINPLTGVQAQTPENVRYMLSVMQSCGMYNFSGEWIFRIGLPAKSGVSGGLIAVVPGLLGIGVYSPLLDDCGNSARGIRACEAFSTYFNLHSFGRHAPLEPIIRRFYTGAEVESKCQRNQRDRQILRDMGSSVHVYELQGTLFFSTVEKLSREFVNLQVELLFVILDCKRIAHIDASVVTLLNMIKTLLEKRDIRIFITHPCPLMKEAFSTWPPAHFMNTTEEALESCENYLISLYHFFSMPADYLPLENMDMMTNLTEEEIDVIKAHVQKIYFNPGQIIIKENEWPAELYMLAAGLASVNILIEETNTYKHIGSLTPGIAFGETSLFVSSCRTASIIAEEPVVCYMLKTSHFEDIAKKYPHIQTKLLINTGKAMLERLKRANDELRFFSS